jgi:hypothetical protein
MIWFGNLAAQLTQYELTMHVTVSEALLLFCNESNTHCLVDKGELPSIGPSGSCCSC